MAIGDTQPSGPSLLSSPSHIEIRRACYNILWSVTGLVRGLMKNGTGGYWVCWCVQYMQRAEVALFISPIVPSSARFYFRNLGDNWFWLKRQTRYRYSTSCPYCASVVWWVIIVRLRTGTWSNRWIITVTSTINEPSGSMLKHWRSYRSQQALCNLLVIISFRSLSRIALLDIKVRCFDIPLVKPLPFLEYTRVITEAIWNSCSQVSLGCSKIFETPNC